MAAMMDVGAAGGRSLGHGFDDSHVCPICREVYVDAFSTLCGHTFCFACITSHLKHMQTCPCCCQVSEGGGKERASRAVLSRRGPWPPRGWEKKHTLLLRTFFLP